ncbi:hypothetical protein BGW80DRAFT_1172822 [Lactifluus volemus]|nr:hypothetical protein BGW80DRAFT_1172822 [Lactifluus volemus]
MTQIRGLVVVVVERDRRDGPGPEDSEKEKVVGGALWLPPGKKIDPSLLTLLRISPWKVIWRWGLVGVKRALIDYGPSVEKSLDEVFGARGLKWLDSWHLLMIAIDPEHEGKGYCSLIVRDGWKRASGKPVYLEASTPHSRDIYAHLGFEFNKENRFGVGSVNEMGVKAKGTAAVGVPVFIMTKVRAFLICRDLCSRLTQELVSGKQP